MEVTKKQELMKFLLENLNGVSRNNIKSLLKYKQITVNGVFQTQFNHMLEVGDIVVVSKYRSTEDIEVLFEDEYLIAINKPENLLSVRNNKGEYTAISMVLKHLDRSSHNKKVYVLHRLDKATSGVFLVAKTEKVQQVMQDNWNEIVKSRDYYAVVEGVVKKNGRIVSNLIENESNMVYSTQEGGKKAITNYKVIRQRNNHTLLDVNIETGRKNQIRVHMKEMGHPVACDMKYGEKSKKISRLALHAYNLEFIHPITNKLVKITSPMPNAFNRVV